MNIQQVLDFNPLLVDPKYGHEMSLRQHIHAFYLLKIDDKEMAVKYAEAYLAQVEDQFYE
jgi:hypothetical protein